MPRFRFPLQPVLDLRQREEDAKQKVVAEIDRPDSHFNGGIRGHTYQELCPDEIQEVPTLEDEGQSWDEGSDEWETLFDDI